MSDTAASTPANPAPLTVYFDGACPVCSREIAVYQKQDGATQLCWVDVSRAAQSDLGIDLTRDAALARMHVRDAGGGLVSGAAAFAAIWSALPRTWWLGRIARLPLVLPLLELGYRLFLRVRPLWRRPGASSIARR